MPSPPKTSLSSSSPSSSPPSPTWKPARLDDYLSLSHAPNAKATCSIVKPVSIKVDSGPNGTAPGFLHLPPPAPLARPPRQPVHVPLSLAEKLGSLPRPMAALRLDYRFPARTAHCVLAAMRELQDTYHMSSRDSRVVGCVGIASHAPRPVLLLHGTGDRTLGHGCSERLYEAYGTGGKRVLRLFEGDDHALTGISQEAEQLVGGICA
ncbi:hypothetical protein COCC4DRAFT_60383 [Bipolaris maydis ATCC 48331]|uniref:Serine aminopeptidase S33 domain-containing protein n=1 Tax=Cochliobolus heterostrophus (strain C4 / ATCC 48331 / race T) TaxID=665024 RepID=N4X9Y5_COCH4|nr:uncharacterized protein COCC4DRAFT_60383 [Bipolaris maydis ATCC 48331]ENI05333.1 hypothetical protein COCC4DRAFT_60383 [Bipolaris maydis ATCC 48331]